MVQQTDNLPSSPSGHSNSKQFMIKRNGANGFGINVVGGTDQPYIPGYTGIFISLIRRKDLDGIKEGDQILEVNGISLADKTHAEAVQILREAVDQSVFTIETNAERRIVSQYDNSSATVGVHPVATNSVIDIDEKSLPSSNVSNVSERSGVRTRNSSASTVNYSVILNDSVVRQQWQIEEGDDDDDTSVANSTTHTSSTATAQNRVPDASPSTTIFMEILFVSLGVLAIGTLCYIGYKRFKCSSKI